MKENQENKTVEKMCKNLREPETNKKYFQQLKTLLLSPNSTLLIIELSTLIIIFIFLTFLPFYSP